MTDPQPTYILYARIPWPLYLLLRERVGPRGMTPYITSLLERELTANHSRSNK